MADCKGIQTLLPQHVTTQHGALFVYSSGKFLTPTVCQQFNAYTVCKGQVYGGLSSTYLLLLGLFIQEDGRLFQSQKLGRTVTKRREFGCSNVIQVFSVPLPPGLRRERRWAFRRMTEWGSWCRDVSSVEQPGNTVEMMLFTNNW